MGRLGAGALQQPLETLIAIASTPVVWLGLASYAIGAVLWMVVLSRLDLGYAYPLLAISYILIPLLAHFLLGEAIPPLRWVGIAVIFVGVIIVARAA